MPNSSNPMRTLIDELSEAFIEEYATNNKIDYDWYENRLNEYIADHLIAHDRRFWLQLAVRYNELSEDRTVSAAERGGYFDRLLLCCRILGLDWSYFDAIESIKAELEALA